MKKIKITAIIFILLLYFFTIKTYADYDIENYSETVDEQQISNEENDTGDETDESSEDNNDEQEAVSGNEQDDNEENLENGDNEEDADEEEPEDEEIDNTQGNDGEAEQSEQQEQSEKLNSKIETINQNPTQVDSTTNMKNMPYTGQNDKWIVGIIMVMILNIGVMTYKINKNKDI